MFQKRNAEKHQGKFAPQYPRKFAKISAKIFTGAKFAEKNMGMDTDIPHTSACSQVIKET